MAKLNPYADAMLGELRRAWKSFPVTAATVAMAGALFLAVRIHTLCVPPEEAKESLRAWGAARQLAMFVQQPSDSQHKQIPQFTGAFDLWDGQWWRVPVSGLHHANLLHLVMNCTALWFLGRLLEPKLGKVAFLVFFLLATTVSMLPEFLLEHSAVGLSGGVYAVFGALMVLRRRDPQVASVFTEGIVRFGLVWLFACLLLTAFEILPIANAAHFSGFAYGWIAGQVLFGVCSPRRRLRFAFLAAHLAIVGAFYYVSHPVWIGRYHWYLASHEKDPQRQTEHLKKAVALDPGLRRPWVILADRYARQGRWDLAWETALTALKHNRTDDESVQLSRKVWGNFRTLEEQQAGMQTFNDMFGQEAEKFRKRLGIEVGQPVNHRFVGDVRPDDLDPDPARSPLDRLFDLSPAAHGRREVQKRDLSSPDVDPNRPDSAAEGTST